MLDRISCLHRDCIGRRCVCDYACGRDYAMTTDIPPVTEPTDEDCENVGEVLRSLCTPVGSGYASMASKKRVHIRRMGTKTALDFVHELSVYFSKLSDRELADLLAWDKARRENK
jgi:hypothetical protein